MPSVMRTLAGYLDGNMSKESRLLSLVLRHKPEEIGITLDKGGWAVVSELLKGMSARGNKITMAELEEIVATNDKQRFSFNETKTKIRANQGHSVSVDLGLKPVVPPKILYHGTAISNLDVILKTGIKKMNRLHVHLSADVATASKVGSRHGKPVVLEVNAEAMHKDGHAFFQSANQVWLTDKVPVEYILVNYIYK